MFNISMKSNKEIVYTCPGCRVEHTRLLVGLYSILHLCPWCKCLLPNLHDLTTEVGANPQLVLERRRKTIVDYHKEKYEDYYEG